MPTGRQIALNPWDKGMDLLSESTQMPTGFTREVNNITFSVGKFSKRPGYEKRKGALDGVVISNNLLANGKFETWSGDNPSSWTLAGEVASELEISEVGYNELYGETGKESANFYATLPQELSISQSITTLTEDSPYRFQVVVSKFAGGKGRAIITDNAGVVMEQMILDKVGVFTSKFEATAAGETSAVIKILVNNTSLATPTNFTINEVSVKYIDTAIDQSRGFNLVKSGDFATKLVPADPIVGPSGLWTTISAEGQTNLVTNGDFDTEPIAATWTVIGAATTIERSTNVTPKGSNPQSENAAGLLITKAVDTGVKATFTTVNNGVYVVNAMVYPVNITSIQVLIRNGNNSANLYDQSHTSLTANAWNLIRFVFVEGGATGGSGAWIQFDSGTRTEGTWYLDDVSVRKDTGAQNWANVGVVTSRLSTDQVKQGWVMSYQFIPTSADDGVQSNVFALTSGVMYKVTVVVYTPGTVLSLELLQADGSGNEFDVAFTGLTASDWNTVEHTFTATATGAVAKLTIDSSTATSGTFYLGLVRLQEVENGTDWTYGSGWTWDGNEADASTAATDLEQTISLEAGTKYIVDYTVRNRGAGSVQPKLGTVSGTSRSTDGEFTDVIVTPDPLTTQKIVFDGTGFTGSIDNVGVYTASNKVGQFDGFTGNLDGELITGIKSFQDKGGSFREVVFTNLYTFLYEPNSGEFFSMFETADASAKVRMFQSSLPSYMSLALVPNTQTAEPWLYFTNGLPFEFNGSLDHTLYKTDGGLLTASLEEEVRTLARVDMTWFNDEGTFLGCKQIAYYHDHLLCGNYNVNGTWFRNRIVWGDLLADSFGRTQGDAGDQGSQILADARGELLRFIKLGDHMVIYFDRSIVVMDPVPTTAIWSFDTRVQGTGLLGPNAVADIGGVHIFAGQDNVFLYDGGLHPRPIGNKIIQKFLASIDVRKKDRIVTQHIPERDQIIFYLPSSETEYGKVAFMYHYLRDTWTHWELGDEVSAVGTAQRGGTLVTGLNVDGTTSDENILAPQCRQVSEWPKHENGDCRTVAEEYSALCVPGGGGEDGSTLNDPVSTGGGFGPVLGTSNGRYIDQSNLTGDDANMPFPAFLETDLKALGSRTGEFGQRGIQYGEFGRINEIELRYKGGRFNLSYKTEENDNWRLVRAFAAQTEAEVIRHPFNLVARFIAFRFDIPEDSYGTEVSVLSVTVRPWGSRHLDGN